MKEKLTRPESDSIDLGFCGGFPVGSPYRDVTYEFDKATKVKVRRIGNRNALSIRMPLFGNCPIRKILIPDMGGSAEVKDMATITISSLARGQVKILESAIEYYKKLIKKAEKGLTWKS